jgi:primosomal protein N' (replication factor Y)
VAASRKNDQLWLLPREGAAGAHCVAQVALDAPARTVRAYAVPPKMAERVRPGTVVRVPYRGSRRLVEGTCVGVAERPWDHTLAPIAEVLDGPSLSGPLIELGLWVADYYHCPPGKALRTMLPAASRRPPMRRVRLVRRTDQPAPERLSARQRALLEALADGAEHAREAALLSAQAGASTLRTLIAKGLISQRIERQPDGRPLDSTQTPARDPDAPEDRHVLSDAQAAAVDRVNQVADASKFGVFLLFGVPGSGKTEVYVRAIRRVVAAGKQAILIVPEIALATHLIERLARRFERVAILHSRLSESARARALQAIHLGQVDVVVGTRTAVFAPCERLGLIVVDEEQESSLKNQTAPRYHARDCAIKRGEIEKAPVVLGTATPALETWFNASRLPHYEILRLPRRVGGAEPPQVCVVRSEDRAPGATLLTQELLERLREVLDEGEQAILLHNRRGYAAWLRCTACGTVVSCVRCGAHLVFHRAGATMKCHGCGAKSGVPQRCPDGSCAGALERTGLAIQRLEEELTRLVPAARLLRFDSDAMRRRDDYREALARFERREADVLLGTQMVAKGLDFPAVRLVGVIEADASLHFPDFRAAERTFQLVAQVVGRAGRREGRSIAVVQSAAGALPVIRQAVNVDYEGFAAEELRRREAWFYPPFARMVRLVVADAQPGLARREAERLAEALRRTASRIHAGIRVDDAGPCVANRRRDLWRFEVLVLAPRGGSAQRLLHDAETAKLLFTKAARLTIDVDPVDLT